jgi:molecular chaperone DnaK
MVNGQPKHLNANLTRAQFEELVRPLIERSRGPCQQALKDAKLSASDITDVVLVGGSTRMPCAQRIAEEIFGKKAKMNVNPDEVVALGAAVQGGVLTGEVKDVLLLDVTPLSLGIETEGQIMTVLIERNTTIPTSKSQVFSTAADNQPAVDIKAFQGERRMARDNRLLGEFTLDGIPPAPRGMPQIEVTFNLDANGILEVKAKDKATGKEQKVSIQGSSGLSKDEVERMVDEAKANADSDLKKEEVAKTRNEAEHKAYQVRRMLDEHKDKLEGDESATITAAVEKVEGLKTSENLDDIKAAVAEMETAAASFGKRVHEAAAQAGAQQQAAQGAAGAAEGGDSQKSGDDIKDAEFTVKDDK